MVDLNKLVGSIKKIHKSDEKIIDAMIIDYTYNPKASTNRQHKIDYVTTNGIVGNIYVNEYTSYTDISVNEHVKKYLTLIKESVLRKKEAYEIYKKETANIENLIMVLVKEDNPLSQEDFEQNLTSKVNNPY